MKDMICNKYGIEYESLKDKEVIIWIKADDD